MDVRLEFPKGSPGFKMLKNMSGYRHVMPGIPKDYRIINRADVGGRYGNEWESANTTVWAAPTPTVKLPKTGYNKERKTLEAEPPEFLRKNMKQH